MPKKKRNRKNPGNIREDILDAIQTAFPDGIVEMPCDPEGNRLDDRSPELKMKLLQITDAELLYERESEGGPEWEEDADAFEDPPIRDDQSSSYRLFFLGLRDERFKYGTEDEVGDGDGDLQRIQRVGTIGCAVAISELAPFAIIRFDAMEQSEDGGYTIPDIFDHMSTLDGDPIDMETHFRETMGDEAVRCLTLLRDEIAKILEALGITLLPDDEARKPVPWLHAGEEALVGEEFTGEQITVKDAFFFLRSP